MNDNNTKRHTGRNKSRPWSDTDIALLKDLYREGRSLPYLAARLRRTPGAVRMQLSRQGVTRPASKPARRTLPETEPTDDLAQAIQDHLGITAPHEVPEARVTLEDLPQVAASYEAFNTHVLRINHPAYQLEVIEAILSEPLVAVVKGRQIGMSLYCIGPAVAFFAITHPFSTVLLTSLAQRQATFLLRRVKNLIAGNAALKRSLVDASQERLRLSNGAEILSLPSGIDGASLRGYSPDLVVVDEASFVPDKAIQDAILPSLSVTGGNLALVSTPWGRRGFFYRAAEENPAFRTFNIPSTRSPFVSKDFLEARKADTDPLSYRTEYGGEFVESADAYFSHSSIQGAIRDYELVDFPRGPDFLYFMGVDWGRRVDASVVTVVERDDSTETAHYRVVHIKEFDETPYTEVVGYIKHVSDTFHAQEILADEGAGLAQIDTLRDDGYPIRGYSFNVRAKADLMSNLKLALEGGHLDIPDHRRLILQLSNFEYQATPAGNLKLHGKFDDIVDSAALAAYAARRDSWGHETASVGDLLEASAEALRGDAWVPVGQSQFDPRVSAAMRYGSLEAYDPRCPECGASWRSGSHVKVHRLSDCQRAGDEDI